MRIGTDYDMYYYQCDRITKASDHCNIEVLQVEGDDMFFWLIVLKVAVHIFCAPKILRCGDFIS